MLRQYFRERLLNGIRRLPHSADLLSEVLIEIAEDIATGSLQLNRGTLAVG